MSVAGDQSYTKILSRLLGCRIFPSLIPSTTYIRQDVCITMSDELGTSNFWGTP